MALEITVGAVTTLAVHSREKCPRRDIVYEQMEKRWIQNVLISLSVPILCFILLGSGFPRLGRSTSP